MSNAVATKIEPQQDQALTIVDRAIMQGSSVEVIEKLIGLQERYDANVARKEFDAAVATAKAEIQPVIKNKTGHNSKRYADFSAIARAVDPIISKFGLSYRFRTRQDDRIHVTCVLAHKAGHFEETTLAGPSDTTGNKNAIQAIGSTLTYLQRYSLVQMLGLAASEDDDDGTRGGAITEEQADTIRALILETKADATKFLKYIGAPSIPDIPAAKFTDAVAALEAKRSKS